MGQQQLLLLVLGVIIVGIAVVAGIGMFNAAAEESVKDELSAQLMAIGANAQQWYKKPTSMGGGNGTFIGYTLPDKMSVTASTSGAVDAETGVVSGTRGYISSGPSTSEITITATPREYASLWTAVATVTAFGVDISFTDETTTTGTGGG